MTFLNLDHVKVQTVKNIFDPQSYIFNPLKAIGMKNEFTEWLYKNSKWNFLTLKLIWKNGGGWVRWNGKE